MDALIFILIALIPILFELVRQTRFLSFDGLLFVNLSFAIAYGYAGIVYFYLSPDLHHLHTAEERYIAGSLCLISYSAAIGAYHFAFKRIDFGGGCWSYVSFDETSVFHASILAFILGGLSVLIYSSMYGGLANAFRYAATIRSGFGEDLLVGGGSFLFFKNLIPLLQFFPMVMLGRLLEKPAMARLLLFLSCFCAAVFGLLLMSGRGRVVLFIAFLLICAWVYKSNVSRLKPVVVAFLLPVVLGVDFFITYGKEIFRMFDTAEVSFSMLLASKPYIPFYEFTSYYSHRVESIITAVDDTKFFPTYFYDAFAIPLFVIPSRLTGIAAPDSISYINTFLQTGLWDSMTPPGLVAYGYYSMGVFGVVISSVVLGFVVAFVDKKNWVEGLRGNPAVFYRIPFLVIFCVYYIQGDPRVLAVNLSAALIFIVLAKLACLRFKIHG